jgi:hypothetical protein
VEDLNGRDILVGGLPGEVTASTPPIISTRRTHDSDLP